MKYEIHECKPISTYFQVIDGRGVELIDENTYLNSSLPKGYSKYDNNRFELYIDKQVKEHSWPYIELITRAIHFPPEGAGNLIIKLI